MIVNCTYGNIIPILCQRLAGCDILAPAISAAIVYKGSPELKLCGSQICLGCLIMNRLRNDCGNIFCHFSRDFPAIIDKIHIDKFLQILISKADPPTLFHKPQQFYGTIINVIGIPIRFFGHFDFRMGTILVSSAPSRLGMLLIFKAIILQSRVYALGQG